MTTSSSANTLVDQLRILTVGNDFYLVRVDLVGKGQAQSSITGIQVDLIRYGTASTTGTAITPNPRNPRAAAADDHRLRYYANDVADPEVDEDDLPRFLGRRRI